MFPTLKVEAVTTMAHGATGAGGECPDPLAAREPHLDVGFSAHPLLSAT